jgi:SSS family solute:Na+ symporter
MKELDPSLIIVIIYLLVILIVGLVSGRKVKDFKEYAIGNRNLPTIVMGMTVCATLIGSGSSLGTATEVFKFGSIVILAKYGVSLGALIIAYLIVPKMERFLGKLSVGEIMGEMYGNKVRIITGICGALLSTGRVAAQVMALGFVGKFLFGLPEALGIICGASVIILYSASGGIKSVVFTDVLQFVALAITIPIILNFSLKSIGGYTGLIEALPNTHLTIYPNKENFFKYLFIFFYMSIPMLTPPFTQRILMSSSTIQAKKSFIFMACTDMIFTTIAGVIGLVAYAKNPGLAPNGVFLYLVSNLNYGLKAMAVIGILSVIMSTADSYLNTITTSVVNDVLRPCKFELSFEQELFLSKIITIAAGVGSVLMAVYFDNIFELAVYSSNFWGPIIVGPLLFGLFEVKISKKICLISMVIGVFTFLTWEYFEIKAITQIYSVVPGILSNIFSMLILKHLVEFHYKAKPHLPCRSE